MKILDCCEVVVSIKVATIRLTDGACVFMKVDIDSSSACLTACPVMKLSYTASAQLNSHHLYSTNIPKA